MKSKIFLLITVLPGWFSLYWNIWEYSQKPKEKAELEIIAPSGSKWSLSDFSLLFSKFPDEKYAYYDEERKQINIPLIFTNKGNEPINIIEAQAELKIKDTWGILTNSLLKFHDVSFPFYLEGKKSKQIETSTSISSYDINLSNIEGKLYFYLYTSEGKITYSQKVAIFNPSVSYQKSELLSLEGLQFPISTPITPLTELKPLSTTPLFTASPLSKEPFHLSIDLLKNKELYPNFSPE